MSGPWILLRGLTRESRHWGAFATLLAAREGAMPIDLPGNGTQAHARSPLVVDAYVDLLRADVEQRGARAPSRVLAMSLGGMVATAWALRYPEEIERLVLVNTSMRPHSRVYERLRPSAWPALARVARYWDGNDSGNLAETLIHGLTCARRDTLAADLETWRAIRAGAHVSRANALRQLAAAASFKARGAPRCAVLVVSSRGDRLVNPVCSARLARTWGAPHVEHPWAGHDLPHDDPQWLLDTLHAGDRAADAAGQAAGRE
ncbi:alpha/beta fold hydrolase [Paraburkholderia acidiphila]|uniref:Alpha/beta fold hydrolase n=1 Tax=Paraburkholderia acidiphila TaxID=2571747 RepID=A0A7Z2G6Q0_9BURK|nr:alpha/beta hydrolase [Paraburkholderia acidiphila]QGZ56223.1 alpha/beta fold hydrolase [Paraburkholderia acidiphila]